MTTKFAFYRGETGLEALYGANRPTIVYLDPIIDLPDPAGELEEGCYEYSYDEPTTREILTAMGLEEDHEWDAEMNKAGLSPR